MLNNADFKLFMGTRIQFVHVINSYTSTLFCNYEATKDPFESPLPTHSLLPIESPTPFVSPFIPPATDSLSCSPSKSISLSRSPHASEPVSSSSSLTISNETEEPTKIISKSESFGQTKTSSIIKPITSIIDDGGDSFGATSSNISIGDADLSPLTLHFSPTSGDLMKKDVTSKYKNKKITNGSCFFLIIISLEFVAMIVITIIIFVILMPNKETIFDDFESQTL